MSDGVGFIDGADARAAAAGLRALAAPGERRCELPTRDALEVLAEALAGADLTPLGWVAAVNELAYAVTVQRKVEAELARADRSPAVERPVVIGGLPRSGTAYLHQLLALSPSLRTAREWEVASPTATSEARRVGDDKLVREAVRLGRVRIELLEVVAPRLPELSPVSAHTGEGCTQLLHHTLCSLQLLMMFRATGYTAWLEEQDLRPVYRFWAAQLRLLDDRPGLRWLGASPYHMFGYDGLWSAAPDTTVVHVRRDPAVAFEAFVGVVVSVREAFSDRIDPRATAQEWLALWASMLRRATDAAAVEGRQLLVVEHGDLHDDPVGVVASLCTRLGLESPPPRTVASLASVLHERDRERLEGLDRFGVDRRGVEDVLLPLQAELDRGAEHLR